MSRRQEIYLMIAQGKKKDEIIKETCLSARSVERYIKEFNATPTSDTDKKRQTTSDKKRAKEKAKALIITGGGIIETSEKVGIPKSTIGDMRAKENLQQSQAEFLKALRERHIKEIEQAKEERLATNREHLNKISQSIAEGEANRTLQVALLENERTEQEILESDRLERLIREQERQKAERQKFELEKEKFEFEKEKFMHKLGGELLAVLDELSDHELKEVLEFAKSRGAKNEPN